MQWLNKIVDEVIAQNPDGEILVESGISPSGSYHLGYLREILICDAIVAELKARGRHAQHIHFVDDQDGFRKVPADLPAEYEQYLGKPLFDIPAPDGSAQSYADYRLKPFLNSMKVLGVGMKVLRSHKKYQTGFFTAAIEIALENIESIAKILETVSGHKLSKDWSPIQVNEDGYLKKRPFVSLDKGQKTITYLDKEKKEKNISYIKGDVKLDWRIDWPARWWLLGIDVEPSGRDHSTKGGSYDTGAAIVKKIFKTNPPLAVPYEFINLAGQTKKMSASVGNVIEVSEVVEILPPEVARYFVLNSPPNKTLSFDSDHISHLIDEFSGLLDKTEKTNNEKQLIKMALDNLQPTVSSIPFSILVAAYQAALKDVDQTFKIISRTAYKSELISQKETVTRELHYINNWLEKWAPEDIKFSIKQNIGQVTESYNFSPEQKIFLANLAKAIEKEKPAEEQGEWIHKTIYELKDQQNLPTKETFEAIYYVLIGKASGPRAGWFLSILPRDWLIKRLRFEK